MCPVFNKNNEKNQLVINFCLQRAPNSLYHHYSGRLCHCDHTRKEWYGCTVKCIQYHRRISYQNIQLHHGNFSDKYNKHHYDIRAITDLETTKGYVEPYPRPADDLHVSPDHNLYSQETVVKKYHTDTDTHTYGYFWTHRWV